MRRLEAQLNLPRASQEQEPARGQDLEGGAEWTVADALTEPMAAGESASTPGATETAAALRAVRPPWS